MYIRRRQGSCRSNQTIALMRGEKGHLRNGDGLLECVEFTGNDKSWQPPL